MTACSGKAGVLPRRPTLIWTVTSVAAYDLLVIDMRLSVRRYVRLLRTTMHATLCAPFDPADVSTRK